MRAEIARVTNAERNALARTLGRTWRQSHHGRLLASAEVGMDWLQSLAQTVLEQRSAERDNLEAQLDSAKSANTAVWVLAERASRKGYELDPDDVLEALR